MKGLFMGKWICEVPLDEWLEVATKIQSSTMSSKPTLRDNIFSSLQFIDEEIETSKQQKAFCLMADNQKEQVKIAWASVYYLSPTVLRLRGLYVEPAYRQQGQMSFLLKEIFNLYSKKAKKALSFSTPKGLEFHKKFGFTQVKNFTPRSVEFYDIKTGTYTCDENEIITLFEHPL